MAVSDENTRISLTINKEFKAKLQKLAKSQNRDLSNLIITVLMEYSSKKR